MDEYLSLRAAQIELKALQRGEHRTWAEIGRLLGSVELHGAWRGEAGSFTEWLKQFAKRLGKKESSFWRYLTAGRYYIKLRKQMLKRNNEYPLLQNLPDRISPENLELLSKLERVAPPEAIYQFSDRVIAGVATRAELRDAWKIFRPILAGQTARGQLNIPRFDPSDISQVDCLMEAMVFRALSQKDANWLGNDQSDFCEIFANVWLSLSINQRKMSIGIDAVVVTGQKSKAQLILHCIQVVGMGYLHTTVEEVLLTKYCDFMWVAMHEKILDDMRANIPKDVGIMTINDGGFIHMVRPAIIGDDSGKNSCELAKALLLKLLAG